MSMDTADDLEYAENLIGALAARLQNLVEYVDRTNLGDADAVVVSARVGMLSVADYCRPTCRWRDEGECADGDTCGCLCKHGQE